MADSEIFLIKVESTDVIIATTRVLLTLNSGAQKILAKITLKSLKDLNLRVNQPIFAYIKAMSIANLLINFSNKQFNLSCTLYNYGEIVEARVNRYDFDGSFHFIK